MTPKVTICPPAYACGYRTEDKEMDWIDRAAIWEDYNNTRHQAAIAANHYDEKTYQPRQANEMEFEKIFDRNP